MTLPTPLTALCRHDSLHGKLYFTLAQMRVYGLLCFHAGLNSKDEADESKTPASPDVDFLRGMMGMKP